MQPSFSFNVLVEAEKDGSGTAWCLEAGLVASSKHAEELPAIMAKMLSRQLEFALTNDNPSDLYHPAPPEVWERFKSCVGSEVKELETTTKNMSFLSWPGMALNQRSYATCS